MKIGGHPVLHMGTLWFVTVMSLLGYDFIVGNVFIDNTGAAIFLILLLLGFYRVAAAFAYYFYIIDTKIEVFNYWMPWYRKKFYFKDVQKVMFFAPPFGSSSILIYTSTDQSNYNISSLNAEKMKNIKQLIIINGIEVEDKLRL